MKDLQALWKRGQHWGKSPQRLVDLMVLAACLLVLWQGWCATHDLHWPPDFDLYRDASIAQTMLDGGGLSDPAYAGERLWYNPLVPAIVAGLSRLTGWPVPTAYARVGTYLNLLAPIFFYVMVTRLFDDRIVAAVSTVAFLFVTCQFPASRACATYSPWLFTANFAQVGFYLSITLYSQALRRDRRRDFLFVGLMLGLTFLAHTAPALILGGMIGLHGAWIAFRNLDRNFTSPRLHETVVRLSLIVGAALIVSYPYWRIIVGHYRLQILNPAPNSWIYSELKLKNLLTLIRTNLTLPNLVASFGMITLWTNLRERVVALLTLWLTVCLIFIGLSDLSQIASRLELPTFQIVPPIHYLFYIKALVSVLFGYGVLAGIRFLLEFIKYVVPASPGWLSNPRQASVERMALVLIALLAAMRGYGSFVAQPALNETSERAKTVIPPGWRDAYTWIRANTEPSDVFLTSPYFGLHVVTPAGRKVVALKPVFSNPFIDAATRLEHNALLYDHLQAGKAERFAILASAYDVEYVVATAGDFDEPRTPPAYLQVALENEDVTIYKIAQTNTDRVNLGGKVEFLGSVLSRSPGEPPQIDLYLRCIAPMKRDYTLWFHATIDDRTINFDHTLPTSKWHTGQIVTNTVTLDLPPGMYNLSFGLWTWQDGQRLWRKDNHEADIQLSPLKIKGEQ